MNRAEGMLEIGRSVARKLLTTAMITTAATKPTSHPTPRTCVASDSADARSDFTVSMQRSRHVLAKVIRCSQNYPRWYFMKKSRLKIAKTWRIEKENKLKPHATAMQQHGKAPRAHRGNPCRLQTHACTRCESNRCHLALHASTQSHWMRSLPACERHPLASCTPSAALHQIASARSDCLRRVSSKAGTVSQQLCRSLISLLNVTPARSNCL